eukprot:scaffold40104_cov42-Phaeocystis_antarctica.AAC.1
MGSSLSTEPRAGHGAAAGPSSNPNAAGLELQSPEPSGATGRASPAERRASARLARSMRSPASTKRPR